MSETDKSKTDDQKSAEDRVADLEAELKEANERADRAKAESRKQEGRAKSNADAAKALEDAQAREKSAEDRLADAERRLDEADRRALRVEVAAEKKLPASLSKRLQGNTRAEIEDDADDLLASIAPETDAGDKAKDDKGDDKTKGSATDDEGDGGKGNGKPPRPKEKALQGGASSDGAETADDRSVSEVVESVPRSGF